MTARDIIQQASSAVPKLVKVVADNDPSLVQEIANIVILKCDEIPEGTQDSQLSEGHKDWGLGGMWIVFEMASLTTWRLCRDSLINTMAMQRRKRMEDRP